MYPSDPSPIVVLHYHAAIKKLDVHASEDAEHTRFILQADGLPPLLDALRAVKRAKADACMILETVENTETTSIPERLANQVDMAMYANVDVPEPIIAFLNWIAK
jgi:LEA14-like dessication related protein